MTDRAFRVLTLAAGLLVLLILALILVSTADQARPWFEAEGLDAIFTDNWDPASGSYGALGLIYGTFLVAVIAMAIAVPVSIGIALFVNEVAPRLAAQADRVHDRPARRDPFGRLRALAPQGAHRAALERLRRPVPDAFSGVPILGDIFGDPSASGQAFLTAGIVVGIMVTPIVTAITREVFATCPASQKEAALAMGATRWEMIRGAVFPHSRGGVVAAFVIGFGRGVGETIAVALVIGSSPRVSADILGPGDTMASIIANQFGEASGTQRAALIGLGLLLLVLTVIIGMLARAVLARSDRKLGIAA